MEQDGTESIWLHNPQTNQVVIMVPVKFTGSAATAHFSGAVASASTGIEVVGDPSIRFLIVPTEKPILGKLNTMDVSPGSGRCGSASSCAWGIMSNMSRAHVDSTEQDPIAVALHEGAGHFSGLEDQYTEGVNPSTGARVTTPLPAYAGTGNMMAEYGGTKVTKQQVEAEVKANRHTKKVCEATTGTRIKKCK